MPFDLSSAVPVGSGQQTTPNPFVAQPGGDSVPAVAAPAGAGPVAASTVAAPQASQGAFDLGSAVPVTTPAQQPTEPGAGASPGWWQRLQLPANDPNSVENTIRRTLGAPAVGSNPEFEKVANADSPFPDVMPVAPNALKNLASAAGAGVKYLLRGGEANIPKVAANIDAAAKAGTSLSVGQATGNRAAQAAESFAGKYPGSAGVIANKATSQASEIGQQVEKIADGLSPNASPSVAGRTIEKGLAGQGGFVDRFKQGQKALYDKLDEYIKPSTPVNLSNTEKTLSSMNQDIKGAKNLSAQFKNQRVMEIQEALKNDARGQGGAIPYEAVKKLRTLVGQQIENSSLSDSVPRSQWRALYGSLSRDLEGAAVATGNPEAVKAMQRANAFTAAGHARIDDVLDKVAKQDIPEKVFKSAVNPSDMQAGATKIQGIMKSLTPAERDVVKSAFVRRMGTASAGAQGAEGDIFSSQTFLTNWNKMSPAAKDVMFSSKDGNLRASLDSIAKTAETIKEGGKVFANPSGSGQIVAAASLGSGITSAALSGRAGTAAVLLGSVPAANLTAKLMTNPRFVGWLARASKSAGPDVARQAVMSLGKTMQGEPDDVQQDAQAYAQSVEQPSTGATPQK